MKWLRCGGLAAGLALAAGPAAAVESDPLPPPEDGARATAVALYNQGVKVMLDKRYAQAQRLFEQALEHDERIPEAHNNLAFSLRMQSPGHFARAMRHYERALELDPKLAQAYMYRGVLFTQVGDLARARADLERLKALDLALAEKLERAIAEGVARDERGGLAPQLQDIY
jgi:Flp pilus assembly protein TadD